MSVRAAAVVVIVWIALTFGLQLVGAREHVEVLAGALGSPLEMTLGLATVVVHLYGVLVVGECVISAAMLWIADRLTRR